MKGALHIMKIQKSATAGTMESSDVYVEIEPCDNGINIELESVVEKQFGAKIKEVVCDVLSQTGVQSANVHIVDRGALECVIRARVETAIMRGKGAQ